MKHHYPTTHGPEWLDDGRIRFRLWAPSAKSVHLLLDEHEPVEMQRGEDGWMSVVSDRAKAGSRYRFLINGKLRVPDPASRYQPVDVEGPSEVIGPRVFDWPEDGWQGRPWEEAVIYELHVGCFSPEGSYRGIEQKLDHLVSLGITAIELMPIAEFGGERGWGYDSVLPYAPENAYGRPEALKHLIAAAHARGLMVFLDVVYNHFGPLGNYLHSYAERFFTGHYQTPWGAAIDFEDAESRPVRDFFIENALYWLHEYRFDGLRFDAVHAIRDASAKHFLDELAERIRASVPEGRHVHLILENEHNEASRLEPGRFTAQWNDDIHHVFHVLLTGESEGYYRCYQGGNIERLGRCLTQGFAYQGEPFELRDGEPRGEPSSHLPPGAFIGFIQNHDQIGNRALGERIAVLAPPKPLRLMHQILLLNPAPPMLFMGEEWGANTPFLFFCDYEGELAEAVRSGRRSEFAHFPAFSDPEKQKGIPDPNAVSTFRDSCLNWSEPEEAMQAGTLSFIRNMLTLRHNEIVPLLTSGWRRSEYHRIGETGLDCRWHFGGGSLRMIANLSDAELAIEAPEHRPLFGNRTDRLGGWEALWVVHD